jgi:hypothetical protein
MPRTERKLKFKGKRSMGRPEARWFRQVLDDIRKIGRGDRDLKRKYGKKEETGNFHLSIRMKQKHG